MFLRTGYFGVVIVGGLAVGLCAGCGEGRAEPGPIETTLVFGEVGRQAGQFSYPRAMAGWTDADGDWLVVIDKTARVQRFDARTGAFVGGFRMPRMDRGKPTGVTVGPMPGDAGRRVLYIADTHEHRVLGFDLPAAGSDPRDIGEPLFELGGYGEGDGEFVYPTDVEVLTDADGRARRVYVSEYGGNDRVSCFEPVVGEDGAIGFAFLFSFGEQGGVGGEEEEQEEDPLRLAALGTSPVGTGEEGSRGEDAPARSDQSRVREHASGAPSVTLRVTPPPSGRGRGEIVRFNRPQEMLIDAARGELIVCDAINHRVGRFTLDGGLIGWVGSAGRALGAFDHPYALAMLEDGTSLVCEFGTGRVQHIDVRTGASFGQFGQPGRGDGQLGNPWEVVVLGDDAFVLDSGNNRVMRFDVPSGRRAVAKKAQGFESPGLGARSDGDS